MLYVAVFVGLLVQHTHAAPATGTCLCVHGVTTHVNIRTAGSLSGHIVTQVVNAECFKFAGHTHVADGYTWYQFQDVHGHAHVWAASNFFQASAASSCSGTHSTTSGGFAAGMVSQHCLQCICDHESGCRPLGCHYDVSSDSCGYFQIKESYWIDCGRLGTSWHACADDKQCSSQCVQNNMKRYAAHYNCPLTCESYARIHNGGPHGCHYSSTLGYWDRLQKQAGCHGVQ